MKKSKILAIVSACAILLSGCADRNNYSEPQNDFPLSVQNGSSGSENSQKSEQYEQSESLDNLDKSGNSGKTDSSEQSKQSEQPSNSGNLENSEKSENKDNSDTAQSDKPQMGGTDVNELFDIAVSYANWTENREIYFLGLNADKLSINSVQHLPIFKFDTLQELENFKTQFADVLSMNSGYDEVSSFNETTAKYDSTFFEENTLMLTYVTSGSGSDRFGVNSIFCDGNSFVIHVEQTNSPEIGTCDMAGWFITVAVPDSMVKNCTSFDADFNNIG